MGRFVKVALSEAVRLRHIVRPSKDKSLDCYYPVIHLSHYILSTWLLLSTIPSNAVFWTRGSLTFTKRLEKKWKNGTPSLGTFRRNDKFKKVAVWLNIPDWNLCLLSSPNLINLWDKFQAFEACFGNGNKLWNRFLRWTLTLTQELKDQGDKI